MSSETWINILAALGGAVAMVLVGMMTYLSRRGATLAVREDLVLRSLDELVETLQREVKALREQVVRQEVRLERQALQITALRKQLGLNGG